MQIRARKPVAQPLNQFNAERLPQLQQLIIRQGEEGGVLTKTEYGLSKFCAEEKLRKRSSERLIAMLKRRDFVNEDIHAD
jgi:hypothetical protein